MCLLHPACKLLASLCSVLHAHCRLGLAPRPRGLSWQPASAGSSVPHGCLGLRNPCSKDPEGAVGGFCLEVLLPWVHLNKGVSQIWQQILSYQNFQK